MKYLKHIPDQTLLTLRFFIPPFLTLVLGKVLFELLAVNSLDLNPYMIKHSYVSNEISTLVKLNETKARLLWVTSVMVYFFYKCEFRSLCMEYTETVINKNYIIDFYIDRSHYHSCRNNLFYKC